ncbi:peptidase [candidate division WOR-1 bacterium RIFCSPHIGHO2_01_FULL_53_15]|uniref:Peptidase n=1 Tax=candidate division WOR-1 bacterium RIFCSPHIGHO2_01_FULL_53_15 TaxID=1802564 RepID=A0A1F4Q1P8_UNCSA|nr:MAG: peptidase [candidate division WOR-1 bacterium RIFCSPHIGHO2_01_FULL_53_15]OGC13106.1 MAG: peptidase [candidate division WOR-1 bacterium RIFCSPHIGHO2_02_FULL_53_26]
MFYDPTFILLIPALLLAFYAQWKVKSTYAKYSEVACSRGYTGAQVARYILDDFRLQDIAIESTPGELSDHYDPRDRKLRLSQRVYESNSVAAIGVAAHEAGHAIQDAKSYVPLKLRNGLVPMTNLGTTMAFPLFILGMFAGLPQLMDIGIVLFSLAVVFSVVTLPVEFNASSRAIRVLADGNFLTEKELPMARAVLNAAALTYVAATTMAVLNLARLLIMRQQRD